MSAAGSTQPGTSTQVETRDGRRVVTGHLFRVSSTNGVRFSTEAPPPPPPPPPTVRRPSRLARMLAFAHGVEAAICCEECENRADAARKLGLTRARLTQLLDLTLLAPDLQERILFSEAVDGVEPFTERGLRDVVRERGWGEQRLAWRSHSAANMRHCRSRSSAPSEKG